MHWCAHAFPVPSHLITVLNHSGIQNSIQKPAIPAALDITGSSIINALQIFHIVYHHQCNLEGKRVIEYPDIQPCALLELFNSVNQCIPVDKQLSGGFRYIQVILKELVDSGKSFLIHIIRYIVAKDFFNKNLAQINGQLIDQTADTQLRIGDYTLLYGTIILSA